MVVSFGVKPMLPVVASSRKANFVLLGKGKRPCCVSLLA